MLAFAGWWDCGEQRASRRADRWVRGAAVGVGKDRLGPMMSMNILLVEDNLDDARFLRACLDRENASSVRLTRAACMKDAVDELSRREFDVVLLDLNLPDAAGLDCVERIQEARSDTPIVVLSGQGDEDYAVEILNRGVQDYLVKWEGDGRIILRAIRYAIERKRAETRLNYLAQYDSLTGAPNRQYFQDQLERATNRAERNGAKVGLLFLDLDKFKSVNDTMGHHMGDVLLRQVVERLNAAVRPGDVLARLGGDEFAVLLEDIKGPLELEMAAANVLGAFESPFELDGRQLNITASVGATMFPSDNLDPLALLNNADTAMYRAKDLGRNNFKFFTQTMHEEILRYHSIEIDLNQALDRGQFELVYQPQLSLTHNDVAACEALLRWNHPTRGIVTPGEFIDVAEDSGHVVAIGLWVLETACRQLQAWAAAGARLPRIAVNVSAVHFYQPDFAVQVQSTLARHSVPPSMIELELTESSLMKDTADVQRCLHELKRIGVRLAIDDFGMGYSCLNYLKRFPIDVLKIDRSFVSDIGVSDDGQALCGMIISIAKSMGLQTVAEGVENERQLRFLAAEGCELAQGFYVARPMPADRLIEYFGRRRPPGGRIAFLSPASRRAHET
jgi:diguanylate cyclase (GGDEF)-like protein